MTLNSKVLSLVLLSGLAMSGAYAKKSKLATTDWTEESHTVQWSNESCDASNSCDKNDGKTCEQKCQEKACNNLDLNCSGRILNAQGDLSPASAIVSNNILSNSITAPKGISNARIELAWAADLTNIHYRVTRSGTDAAATNAAALFNIGSGVTTIGVDAANILNLPLAGPWVTTTNTNDTWVSIGCLNQLDIANNLTASGSSLVSNFSNNLSQVYTATLGDVVVGGVFKTSADIGKSIPLAQGLILPCHG